MLILKDLDQFQISQYAPIKSAIELIDENKSGIVFVIQDEGQLCGTLTDGDIRRWLLQSSEANLSTAVNEIFNRDYTSVSDSTDYRKIQKLFSPKVRTIPLVDRKGRIASVAIDRVGQVSIGSRSIGPGNEALVIAEIGNNHNGSIETGKLLIDKAVAAGADSAKFQMREMTSLYGEEWKKNYSSEDLGSQYVLDLLTRFNLSRDELFTLFDYCHQKKIIPLCTPWDPMSVDALESYGIEAFKIASADLTNHVALEQIAKIGKPIILSTGMSRELEIIESVDLIQKYAAPLVLLHCNSTYPPDAKDLNLRYMDRLKDIAQCPVGYSGHELGWQVAVAAVAMGANAIEKHLTLDRGLEGNDHKVSLLPEELRQMTESIREIEVALGSASNRVLTQGEILNRETLAKSLFANRDIKKGQTIGISDVVVLAPGKGIQPNRYGELVGRVSRRNITRFTEFHESDITGAFVGCAQRYEINRSWGIPVRYHDFGELLNKSNQSVMEFHMSHGDLAHSPSQFLKQTPSMDLIVHAPEMFSEDHLIDLAAESDSHRERSIREIARVIDCTREIQTFFPDSITPRVVLNAGGWTEGQQLEESERADRYKRIEHALETLCVPDVRVLIQTMPPFPWHFGGRSFHNLFVLPDEIRKFCEDTGHKICLDISHSYLACNFYGLGFERFVETIAEDVEHIHCSDAKGVDGEGLQIGEGEIEFVSTLAVLDRYVPKISLIPEVWQGHKNRGEGFWIAMTRLEEAHKQISKSVAL